MRRRPARRTSLTQYEGIEAFLTLCFAEPPEDAVLDEAMAINMQTSPQVRGYYLGRVVDHRPTYAALEKPLLVTHGANDHVVLASMADLFAQAQPNATVSIYEASGHLPFAEEADPLQHRARRVRAGGQRRVIANRAERDPA